MPTFLACQVECLNLNTNFLLFCDLINRVIFFGLIIFCYGQFFISKTKYKQKGRNERKKNVVYSYTNKKLDYNNGVLR